MNNPINRSDDAGSFSFSDIFSGAGLVSVGVTAILTAATILTCGAAAPLMVAVATVTVTAGAVTVVNGASEVVEGLISTGENSNDGYNFMRDTVMGGNADAYEAQRDFFAGVAEVGTAICGSYYAANGGNVCFVAGTLVLTDDGQIPIEDIEVGDYVYAIDPETGESGYKRVAQTFKRETDELVHVTYSEDDTITTTPTHPFYVAQKGWTEAIELRAGDILVTVNGEYVIVEKVQHELLESPVSSTTSRSRTSIPIMSEALACWCIIVAIIIMLGQRKEKDIGGIVILQQLRVIRWVLTWALTEQLRRILQG